MSLSFGEKLFYAVNVTLLLLAGMSCLIPLMNIVSMSFSDYSAIASGFVGIWPVGFNLDSYKSLIEGTPIVQCLKNSVVITGFGVLFSMIFTILAAFPLSKVTFYWRKGFTLAIVFTMLFGIPTIPAFLVNRSLGIIDTYWALWLPGLISAYNLLVLKSFFEQMPEELGEAAQIDGCSEWRLLWQIVLPLSMPVLATLMLFYGVGYWNVFQSVLININDSDKYNLAVLVQNMIANQSLLQSLNSLQPQEFEELLTPQSIRSAGVVVMLVPLLLVYPFLQKYFVKGVMIGAIKG
ncbi:carbohydrate ABC transporter permease [Paenibacillus qinlingensis]|uniref:carbohydrate ABC transporter permease n=1 Tax=Paenibacillus qinlingensis TaxID=1837343 RepID=UPI001566BD56|nr:carbohydrate ABC transporter permease [Paenibacillus qinlingensis]NQX60770.1 carbohydrate ABC transporter permease [Paenibacillus qinlingensis]